MIPETFKDDFEFDPTAARTMYMCEPPPQEGGFFELPHKVEEAVNRDLPRILTTRSVRDVEMKMTDGTSVIKKFTHLEIEQLPERIQGVDYYMHGDPGLVSDFFAVCVCHVLPERMKVTDGNGSEREIKKVAVDFVITWEPKAKTPVDMLNINEVLLQLARYYSVRQVTFDRWNSANSVQMLINSGIRAEDLSFSNSQQFAMYRNFTLMMPPGLFV